MENQSYKTSSEGNTYCIFFIGRKAESILVADFIKIVRETLSIFIPDGISNFTTLIQYLFEIGKTRSFNIVIDEFQEFYNIRPDVFSDMQNLWDEYRQETKINLVISGSVYSLMQRYSRIMENHYSDVLTIFYVFGPSIQKC